MPNQNTPQTIELESTIFDFDLHPSENIVVSGLISGKLYWYDILYIYMYIHVPFFYLFMYLYIVFTDLIVIDMD